MRKVCCVAPSTKIHGSRGGFFNVVAFLWCRLLDARGTLPRPHRIGEAPRLPPRRRWRAFSVPSLASVSSATNGRRLRCSHSARISRTTAPKVGRLPDIKRVNRNILAATQTSANVAASSSRIPSQISHNGGRSKLMRASITNGVAGGNSEIKRVTRAAGLVIA